VALRKPTILVVTEDPEPSQAISAWLREAGLRVIGCPDPHPELCLCGDAANHARPFAVGADVVLLDLWLASDTMLRGTPAMQLLSHYLDLGKPVVALQRLGAPGARRWRVELVPDRRPSVRSWGRIPPTPRVASARQVRVRTVKGIPGTVVRR